MTFGVVPAYKEFLAHIRSNAPDEDRPYLAAGQTFAIEAHANSEDGRILRKMRVEPSGVGQYGKNRYELTEKQLYSLIKKLGQSSDDEAMSLGSSIMANLGYEWI
jgi:hypothetical protein